MINQRQVSVFILIICLLALNYAGDIADGYLARKTNQITKFGAVIDVAVDSILMLGAYFILGYIGHYSILLMEVALIFNIAIGFVNFNGYGKIVSYVDLFIVIVGIIAIINRFKYYIIASKAYSV